MQQNLYSYSLSCRCPVGKKMYDFTVVIYSWEELLEEQLRADFMCSHICTGDDGWSLAAVAVLRRHASVRAVRREVIMFLLKPSERKGDRRGCADAAAERPNYWPPLHFWRSRSSFESGDNDDSSVLTGMRSLLKPEGTAASAMDLCTYSAGLLLFYLFFFYSSIMNFPWGLIKVKVFWFWYYVLYSVCITQILWFLKTLKPCPDPWMSTFGPCCKFCILFLSSWWFFSACIEFVLAFSWTLYQFCHRASCQIPDPTLLNYWGNSPPLSEALLSSLAYLIFHSEICLGVL